MPSFRVDGLDLHYEDTLAGERAVLLLHAFPLHSGMWSRQIAALAGTHRVIAPDVRGLGRSTPSKEPSTMEVLAGDALALLAHLGIDRVAVAGLSMGGYLAFELHRRAPSLFRGLVLADTRASADPPEGRAQREAFALSALDHGLDWVFEQLVSKLLRPAASAQAVAELRELIAAGTPEGVAGAQRGMARRPDSFETLKQVRCPTLVLVGSEDTLTPPADAEAMARLIPGAELVQIPDAGHIACIENPSEFDQALLRFLGRLPA